MRKLVLSVCAISLLLCHNTRGQLYSVTDIGQEGPSSLALNDLGQVCGTTEGYQAYVWTSGIASNLGTLGSTSFADGINDNGQVVGYSYNGVMHAALYSNGTVTDMGALPNAVESRGLAINNLGEAVGFTITGPGDFPYYATSYQGGTAHNLGTLPTHGGWSVADAINSAGTIVGESGNFAFVYSNQTMRALANFPSAQSSEALAINDSGLIVGYADVPSFQQYHATLWNNGTITDLGILAGLGTNQSGRANSINALGQIVGSTGQHAFIYTGASGMLDLNNMIDPSLGLTLESATGINSSGQILADGSNGQVYLLTPVPEPSPAILVTFGVALFLCRCLSSSGRFAV